MVPLFNGCSRSEIGVIPSNWNTKKASLKKKWIIHYRFYDGDKVKSVQIRGMNEFKDLQFRQEVTKRLIAQELDMLDRQGFNPITKQFMAPEFEQEHEISPATLFIDALRLALEKADVVKGTRIDMLSVVNNCEAAAKVLFDATRAIKYNELMISQVSRRHINAMLEYFSRNNKNWSNNRHNKYKAYLSMLFKLLIRAEAVESNPTKDIESKKKVVKLRPILSQEEEMIIDAHLRTNHYYFWRFMRIFYDSQARETELMLLKKDSHVRIDLQEFDVIVRKGNQINEDVRIISKDLLPLWQEIWEEAKPGQYLFSKFLRPGDHPIRPDQVGRRWKKYVKQPKELGGLGINKDLYSLKHLSTDRIDENYGIEIASAGAGHTNTNTTQIYYAVGYKKRKLEQLKKKSIRFADAASC